MLATWTPTANALPSDGAVVEFLLDDRECPMRGVYALGRFESRWNFYAPTSVRQWREPPSVTRERDVPPMAMRPANLQCFAGVVMAATAATLRRGILHAASAAL